MITDIQLQKWKQDKMSQVMRTLGYLELIKNIILLLY